MLKASALLLAVTLAACGSGAKAPPKADGQVFRLNPERWSETVNNLNMAEVRND